MAAKKRLPGLELGPILINQVQEYLGTRTVNKLTTMQLANISRCCNVLGETVAEILEDESGELRTLSPAKIKLIAPDVHLVPAEEV